MKTNFRIVVTDFVTAQDSPCQPNEVINCVFSSIDAVLDVLDLLFSDDFKSYNVICHTSIPRVHEERILSEGCKISRTDLVEFCIGVNRLRVFTVEPIIKS